MHDTLDYFSKDPIHRRYHHHQLTFGLLYAFTENFVLPLSHDEVVHGKGSLLDKMPGDRWQQLANLRALYAWMWAHPGKQLLFMGGELAQEREWTHDRSLDWHLLEYAEPPRRAGAGARAQPRRTGRAGAVRAGLHARGVPVDRRQRRATNVLSFLRLGSTAGARRWRASPTSRRCRARATASACPRAADWREVLNTDAAEFGGSGVGNGGVVRADGESWHGLPAVGRC